MTHYHLTRKVPPYRASCSNCGREFMWTKEPPKSCPHCSYNGKNKRVKKSMSDTQVALPRLLVQAVNTPLAGMGEPYRVTACWVMVGVGAPTFSYPLLSFS